MIPIDYMYGWEEFEINYKTAKTLTLDNLTFKNFGLNDTIHLISYIGYA